MIKLPIIFACGILVLVASCVSSPKQTSSETPAQTTDPSWHAPLLPPQSHELSNTNIKVTGFEGYDTNFVEAINQNWFNLLDSGRFTDHTTGKVVLEFELHPNGTISHVEIKSQNVGTVLTYVCEKAVMD